MSRAGAVRVVQAIAVAAVLARAPAASAGDRPRSLYAVIIGHNDVPEAARRQDPELKPLHYADDDAALFHELMRRAGSRTFVFSVLDRDTQQRFPELADQVRLPGLAQLAAVLGEIRAAMTNDRAAGRDPVLVFIYSGHGIRGDDGRAGLVMVDGLLTREWLHDQVLATLPAALVHLFVDACHAEATVRPRDVDARTEIMPAVERERYLDSMTLARFPHVGAILASSASARSYEWDVYRSGVFAHQLLSALRGAADVNGDERIEYSEAAAYLAAANSQVDERARLNIVVSPPRIDRRATIVDLTSLKGHFHLRGRAEGAWSGPFFVETESGFRLVDVFAERMATVSLRLPAGVPLYLVRRDGEVALTGQDGRTMGLSSLIPAASSLRPRGGVELSLRRGLFAAPFGPSFYRGYVSQREDFVPVSLLPDPPPPSEGETPGPARSGSRTKAIGTGLLVSAGAAGAAAAVFTGLMLKARADYADTSLEGPALEARDRYHRYQWLSVAAAGAALALAGVGATLLFVPADAGSSSNLNLMAAGKF
jgi:hypothetical protein